MKSSLIVDDSRVVRKVACRILTDLGFTCDEAENGHKAYEYCKSQMPDLILLDWNMPVMSGIEFLEKLRMTEHGEHPVVLFCTTENDFDHVKRAIDAGANEYIMKPFDSNILQSKLIQAGLM